MLRNVLADSKLAKLTLVLVPAVWGWVHLRSIESYTILDEFSGSAIARGARSSILWMQVILLAAFVCPQPMRRMLRFALSHRQSDLAVGKASRLKVMIAAVTLAASTLAFAAWTPGIVAQTAHDGNARSDTLRPITKDDVIDMQKAGVGDRVIMSMMRIYGSTPNLSTADIIDLAYAGVSDSVIMAMMETPQPVTEEQESADQVVDYDPYYWASGYPFIYPWYGTFSVDLAVGYTRPVYVSPSYSHGYYVGPSHSFGGGRGYGGGFGGRGRHR